MKNLSQSITINNMSISNISLLLYISLIHQINIYSFIVGRCIRAKRLLCHCWLSRLITDMINYRADGTGIYLLNRKTIHSDIACFLYVFALQKKPFAWSSDYVISFLSFAFASTRIVYSCLSLIALFEQYPEKTLNHRLVLWNIKSNL